MSNSAQSSFVVVCTITVIILLLTGCGTKFKKSISVKSTSKPISHQLFTDLLQKYVDSEGWVNYKAIKENKEELEPYLHLLSKNHPNDKNWNANQQLAYWINAYNAFTIKLIIDNYPLKSIKDISSGPNIPFVNSTWDIKFFEIEGQSYDLNNIEHNILRKDFDEPRIHFAINCASVSCPPLRNEAFTPEKVSVQLDEQARVFINDPMRNKLGPEGMKLSKIFKWFKGDFTKEKSVQEFIAPFVNETTNYSKGISGYMDYNWDLNEIANKPDN